MSQQTRDNIIRVTLELAEHKPINRITIRNITDAAGITRNTFYYHFHDIYDVLSQVINDYMSKVMQTGADRFDEALFDLIAFNLRYRRIWRNIYNTLGRDRLTVYVQRRLHTLVVNYISVKTDVSSINELDLYLITTFYEEALMGVMIKWLLTDKGQDTPEDVANVVMRMKALFNGSMDLLIQNAHEHPAE